MDSYVYKFLDETGNIIYIGKTDNIHNRMKQHFSKNGHLPSECYESVVTVFYAAVPTKCDADILETFLINKYSPKYNTDKMFYQNIGRSRYQLQEPEWIRYEFKAADQVAEPLTDEYKLQAVLKSNISILNDSEYLRAVAPELSIQQETIKQLIFAHEQALKNMRLEECNVQCEDIPGDENYIVFGTYGWDLLKESYDPDMNGLLDKIIDIKYLYGIPEYTEEVLQSYHRKAA